MLKRLFRGLRSAATAIIVLMIRVYRGLLSPLLPPSCRFEPSCSQYAEQAVQRYGVGRGGWLALRRLLRCHPWNQGGYDPVPHEHEPFGSSTQSPSRS